MWPGGQTALIPKEEGQGVMWSSFVRRDHGLCFHKSKEDFKRLIISEGENSIVIERLQNSKDAMLRRKIWQSLHFQKYHYDISKDSYWSYEDMVCSWKIVLMYWRLLMVTNMIIVLYLTVPMDMTVKDQMGWIFKSLVNIMESSNKWWENLLFWTIVTWVHFTTTTN